MRVSKRTKSVKLLAEGVPHIYLSSGRWVISQTNNPSFYGRQISIAASEFVERLNKALTEEGI